LFKREDVEAGEILAVHQRPAHALGAHETNGRPAQGGAKEAAEDAAIGFVHHGRMNDDGFDGAAFQYALHVLWRPCKGGQRSKRRGFSCHQVAGCTKQPATAAVELAPPGKRYKIGQQSVEQVAFDDLHGAFELAGGMDDGLAGRRCRQPLIRPSNIPRAGLRAGGLEFSCRCVGTRQRDNLMPAPDERSRHGSADRTGTPRTTTRIPTPQL